MKFEVSSVSLSLSLWYPGSGVVLDCIDSWSLQPYYFEFNWLLTTEKNMFSVSSPNFFLGMLDLAINQSFVHILSLVTDNNPSWISGREENGRRYFFKINLRESMEAGQDQTCDPWICSQTRICSQTCNWLRYFWFWRRFLKAFTIIHRHYWHLGHVIWTICANFHSLGLRSLHMKFKFHWPKGFLIYWWESNMSDLSWKVKGQPYNWDLFIAMSQ